LLFALLWWVLSEGRTDAWGVGLASVGLATFASLRLWPPGTRSLALAGLLGYAGFFVFQSVRGGVQVAAQALRPRMDLAPGLLDLPVTLPEGFQRVLLANTLTLLPGTLSVRIDGNRLRVHVLDHRQPIAREVQEAETRVARIWKGDG
jgi:multicomponent Na+:H+ antiporter subunit E